MIENKSKKIILFSEWLREYWRSLFAIFYLIICLFDFLIMPIAYSVIYKKIEVSEVLKDISVLEPSAQITALTIILPTISREWKPITLQESGLFHLSFGAILTGATLMGGLTRNNLAKRGINPYNRYYEINENLTKNKNQDITDNDDMLYHQNLSRSRNIQNETLEENVKISETESMSTKSKLENKNKTI